LYEEKQFLLFDNMDLNHERVIIFAVDEGLGILTETSIWYCDGNFNLSPDHFMQLYVIRVPKNDFFITAVYCLLERKTTSIYETIIKKCKQQNLFPDPRILHVDFEKAIITAANNIFGSELEIRGCFYHLCQSTFRKIQDLGLQTL